MMSTTAAVLALGFGYRLAAFVITGLIVVAAALESGFGFCIGCRVFRLLLRLGIVPQEVCERCNDIWPVQTVVRHPRARAADQRLRVAVEARGGGLEPPITGPEPAVLPITPPPNGRDQASGRPS